MIGLAVKLEDPEHLLRDVGKPGITLCLIPSNHPGVATGKRHRPMGIPFMNGSMTVMVCLFRLTGLLVVRTWLAKVGACWSNVWLLGAQYRYQPLLMPTSSSAIAHTFTYAQVRTQFNHYN